MYNKDPNLRGDGEEYPFTPDLIQEYIRCKNDILYFAEKYFYIISLEKGKIRIPLRDYQKKMLKSFVKPNPRKRHHICLLPRQSGKSTISTVYLLWYALFNEDKEIAILANKEKTAKKILRRVKLAYKLLPLWLQKGIKIWNETEVILDNDTKISSGSTASSGNRGDSINILFLDEFAFVPSNIADEFMASVYPTIASSKKSQIIAVSCVVKGTYVFTDKGPKLIDSFIQNDKEKGYRVPEYTIEGKTGTNNGSIMYNNGKSHIYKISSTSSELKCSGEHKFWACRNGIFDWIKAKDLTNEDFISIKYGFNLWGNNNNIKNDISYSKNNTNLFNKKIIDKDFAYFLGMYYAEGCGGIIKSGRGAYVTLTCGDSLKKTIENIGVTYHLDNHLHYKISSKSLYDSMESLGVNFSQRAPQKEISERLLEMSRENIIAFLQGLFDGDGYADSSRCRVGISLSSKKMIKQIRILLLNLGILSFYSEGITKPTKLVPVSGYYYRLELNNVESKKYFDIVGFRFVRKQKLISKFNPSLRPDGKDIIPFSKYLLHEAGHNSGLFNGESKNKQHFSRRKLLDSNINFTNNNNLKENISENIKWEKISNIEILAEEEVYDFSLNNIEQDRFCHSVIYNGIIGHQTPNGMNHFHHIWKQAVRGDNSFKPIKVRWDEIPGYDAQFKEDTIRDLGLKKWRAEFETKFLGSSQTLVDAEMLERMQTLDPLDREGDKSLSLNHAFSLYEKPVPGARYVIGVDSGKGIGSDYSVAQILRVSAHNKVKQVAMFRDNEITYHKFAQTIIGIAKYYNDAMLMIENNEAGMGAQVAEAIWYEFDYGNIVNLDKKGLGVRATRTSKLAANMHLKRYIENGWLEIVDSPTVSELSRYEEVKPDIFKASGKGHDDCVMALLWGVYYLTTDLFDGKDIEIKDIADEFKLGDGPVVFFDNSLEDPSQYEFTMEDFMSNPSDFNVF